MTAVDEVRIPSAELVSCFEVVDRRGGKIAHVSDSQHTSGPGRGSVIVAHPGAELYGSDRVLLDSVIGLVAEFSRVLVALPHDGPLAAELRAVGAHVVIAPAFVLRKRLMKPRGWGELISTAWRGGRAARRLLRAERPDAVYVSTITLPLWPLLARLRRLPVVLHVHEGEASASTLVKKVLYAPALLARTVLVNSAFSLGVMTSAYRRLASRSTVVLNAVPGPVDPTPPRSTLDGPLRVLFVGRLSPRKGADLAITAVERLRERGTAATLDIAGSVFEGYEPYEESLHAAVAATDLRDAVTFHGFQNEIWALLDRSDVLVVPSRLDEPFGNTAVEGVLAGRPVVVSDTSGLREATAGIPSAIRVEPDSAASLADGLATVVERWPEMAVAAADSRRIAGERHSRETFQQTVADAVVALTLPR
ncbi:MAG: glycosyltransferase family 4 protein [Microbacterium sp.]|nr:glycosyltransferase family 4 protein [Microbacterium sp.]